MQEFYPENRTPLQKNAFCFLPLGHVKPTGWLKNQLRIQAEGQSGHLSEFWPSLDDNSGWLGGTGESWERGPYYLDGFLPMAYLLEDEKLIAEAKRWIEWTLNSVDEWGRFGPKNIHDWWPYGVMLKVLTQYYEVTEDARVIDVLTKFFKYMLGKLPHKHIHSWGKVRWADTVLSIVWLYNRNGDTELLKLADLLMRQGYDWAYNFIDFGHTMKQQHQFRMRTHVVNNAMGIKTPAVQWLLTGYDEHKCGVKVGMDKLDTYHGTAVGLFTGDEHLAGPNPTQGTEVCAVVEYMFSLEQAIQTLGEPYFGDRLEMLCYNALPATFDEKMWAHQYDQQANQVKCTIDERSWTNNHEDANVFGLEPNYGCCTANFHQGWPKYIAHMWMATNDNGLVAIAYGPNQMKAKVRDNGRQENREVVITTKTDYPFDEKITMTLNRYEEYPCEFEILFRIPAWAEGATLTVNGEEFCAEPGTFARVCREWADGDIIELVLPMHVEVERRYNGAVSVKRGPLVYSLPVGEKWEVIPERDREVCPDYNVLPTTDWNYGLLIDPENPEVEVVKKEVGDVIYGPTHAPIELKVKGKKVPEWKMESDQAGELPQSPVKSSEPVEELTLIPYGCPKLRITEFPLIEE